MKGSSTYTIVFSAVLGTVCALLLTGASTLTEPYRKANAAAEEMRNILKVLEVPFNAKVSSEELTQIYEKSVSEEQYGALSVYVYNGESGAIAVPFAGPGLWGPIKGFLALESDKTTIRGVTFHEQEETPGLGGEIGTKSFTDRFKAKTIFGPDGQPGIRIVRGGGAEGTNEVDGITGATMTCNKVQAMLNGAIDKIVKEFTENVQ